MTVYPCVSIPILPGRRVTHICFKTSSESNYSSQTSWTFTKFLRPLWGTVLKRLEGEKIEWLKIKQLQFKDMPTSIFYKERLFRESVYKLPINTHFVHFFSKSSHWHKDSDRTGKWSAEKQIPVFAWRYVSIQLDWACDMITAMCVLFNIRKNLWEPHLDPCNDIDIQEGGEVEQTQILTQPYHTQFGRTDKKQTAILNSSRKVSPPLMDLVISQKV